MERCFTSNIKQKQISFGFATNDRTLYQTFMINMWCIPTLWKDPYISFEFGNYQNWPIIWKKFQKMVLFILVFLTLFKLSFIWD